jgi:hypothetical protein
MLAGYGITTYGPPVSHIAVPFQDLSNQPDQYVNHRYRSPECSNCWLEKARLASNSDASSTTPSVVSVSVQEVGPITILQLVKWARM